MKNKLISVALITVLLCMFLGASTSCTTPAAECRLIISSTGGGSVTTPGEGTHTYDAGKVVNLVATPDAGYQFVNWTGKVDTIANVDAATTTITMNLDYTITANFAKLTYSSQEYFPVIYTSTEFPCGYGIRYHVTDTYDGLDCYVWKVSQYYKTGKPDPLDFVFTLIKDSTMPGGYYVPCSLGGQVSLIWNGKEITAFYAGFPVGNQGNFYMNFSLLWKFSSGDAWEYAGKDYTVEWVGYQIINGNPFSDCIKVTIDDSNNLNPYLKGNGYFILASGVGIVELVFNRTDSNYTSVVSYKYDMEQRWVMHTISGTVNDNGVPVSGIVVGISNADWGTYSLTGATGAFSIRACGPDVVLRICYEDGPGHCDCTLFPYCYEYCVYGVTGNVNGLSIDISKLSNCS